MIQPSPTIPATNVTGLRTRARAVLIGATVLASAVASVDANVVKVAIPAIGHGLHASVGALQWTLTSYLLAVAALLLLSGSLADRFGRRGALRRPAAPTGRHPGLPAPPRPAARRANRGPGPPDGSHPAGKSPLSPARQHHHRRHSRPHAGAPARTRGRHGPPGRGKSPAGDLTAGHPWAMRQVSWG